MKKKYIIGLTIIFTILIIIICLALFIGKRENKKVENKTTVISNIDNYGYSLDDRDTVYMKDKFKELESILNAEEIDYDKYAEVLGILFISDFFTLNNKINKYDVGGLEFILSDKVEDFKSKAMDTIYSGIIDNTYKDRIQELPEVSEVKILTNEQVEMTINDKKESAYKISLEYNYKKDLGYDNKGNIYIVKRNKKLEIIKYEPVIEDNNQ